MVFGELHLQPYDLDLHTGPAHHVQCVLNSLPWKLPHNYEIFPTNSCFLAFSLKLKYMGFSARYYQS